MTKRNQNIVKFALALCVAVLLALTVFAKPELVQPITEGPGGSIRLQPPAFLKAAQAAPSEQADLAFLLEEAGVTAYTKLNQEIDLKSVELRFKTIRQQTDQFISGIVVAPGYEKPSETNYLQQYIVKRMPESVEVQFFLHSEGWIVAYLTKWQFASTLFDWVNYEEKRLTGTLLENVIRVFTSDIGVNDFSISYYDFRYPEATHLILVADRATTAGSENSFDINIPRGLSLHEVSWSVANHYNALCSLNGEQFARVYIQGGTLPILVGTMPSPKLTLGVNHQFAVRSELTGYIAYCGIAIVYQEATK